MRKAAAVYFVVGAFSWSSLVAPALAGATDPAAAAAPAATPASTAEATPESGDQPPSRGLFMLALIPILAGLVGHIGDSTIDKLFAKKPPPPPANPAAAASASPPKPTIPIDQLGQNGNYYAGIAFATYLVGPNGEPTRVDSSTYQFRTGDQFLVRYVANMPGRVDVSNVNPHGQETRLGTWPIAAGQQGAIPAQGAFQFTGNFGDEGLRIAFTPCTSGVPSRDIALTSTATVNYSSLLPFCNDRTIVSREIAVKNEGGMGYAVSQLDKQELQAGAVETRVFMIRFRHAAPTMVASAARDWLITPEESDQPQARQLVVNKSDPDGPQIEVRAPGEVKEVSPPVNIDVTFEPREGHTIDWKSLKVTYLKLFDIDITDRMKPYITPTGIHSDNAKLPPGNHTIEIAVKDDAGHRTVEHFSFTVLKQ